MERDWIYTVTSLQIGACFAHTSKTVTQAYQCSMTPEPVNTFSSLAAHLMLHLLKAHRLSFLSEGIGSSHLHAKDHIPTFQEVPGVNQQPRNLFYILNGT